MYQLNTFIKGQFAGYSTLNVHYYIGTSLLDLLAPSALSILVISSKAQRQLLNRFACAPAAKDHGSSSQVFVALLDFSKHSGLVET